MFRGKIKFVCDKCGHRFEAMDIEYQCTAYSQPAQCPKCGSRHTRPWRLFGIGDKAAYERIWAEMDKKG